MESVGEFDDQDANVGAESNHKAEEIVFCRGEIRVEVFHVFSGGGDFGYAVNEKSDRIAKFGFDFFERKVGIFDGVVENAGDDYVFVQAPFLEDFFNGEGVIDIRFAGFTELGLVFFGCEGNSAL